MTNKYFIASIKDADADNLTTRDYVKHGKKITDNTAEKLQSVVNDLEILDIFKKTFTGSLVKIDGDIKLKYELDFSKVTIEECNEFINYFDLHFEDDKGAEDGRD